MFKQTWSHKIKTPRHSPSNVRVGLAEISAGSVTVRPDPGSRCYSSRETCLSSATVPISSPAAQPGDKHHQSEPSKAVSPALVRFLPQVSLHTSQRYRGNGSSSEGTCNLPAASQNNYPNVKIAGARHHTIAWLIIPWNVSAACSIWCCHRCKRVGRGSKQCHRTENVVNGIVTTPTHLSYWINKILHSMWRTVEMILKNTTIEDWCCYMNVLYLFAPATKT